MNEEFPFDETREVDLSDSYQCPHPEQHEGHLVCPDCYARQTILHWLTEGGNVFDD